MATDDDPNARIGPDVTQASTPGEVGQARLDEPGTAPANPWPAAVPPSISTIAPDTPATPGLAPPQETLGTLRETWPATRPFEVREWMGAPESEGSAVGYEIPPDGDPANWPPARGGFGPATER